MVFIVFTLEISFVVSRARAGAIKIKQRRLIILIQIPAKPKVDIVFTLEISFVVCRARAGAIKIKQRRLIILIQIPAKPKVDIVFTLEISFVVSRARAGAIKIKQRRSIIRKQIKAKPNPKVDIVATPPKRSSSAAPSFANRLKQNQTPKLISLLHRPKAAYSWQIPQYQEKPSWRLPPAYAS